MMNTCKKRDNLEFKHKHKNEQRKEMGLNKYNHDSSIVIACDQRHPLGQRSEAERYDGSKLQKARNPHIH